MGRKKQSVQKSPRKESRIRFTETKQEQTIQQNNKYIAEQSRLNPNMKFKDLMRGISLVGAHRNIEVIPARATGMPSYYGLGSLHIPTNSTIDILRDQADNFEWNMKHDRLMDCNKTDKDSFVNGPTDQEFDLHQDPTQIQKHEENGNQDLLRQKTENGEEANLMDQAWAIANMEDNDTCPPMDDFCVASPIDKRSDFKDSGVEIARDSSTNTFDMINMNDEMTVVDSHHNLDSVENCENTSVSRELVNHEQCDKEIRNNDMSVDHLKRSNVKMYGKESIFSVQKVENQEFVPNCLTSEEHTALDDEFINAEDCAKNLKSTKNDVERNIANYCSLQKASVHQTGKSNFHNIELMINQTSSPAPQKPSEQDIKIDLSGRTVIPLNHAMYVGLQEHVKMTVSKRREFVVMGHTLFEQFFKNVFKPDNWNEFEYTQWSTSYVESTRQHRLLNNKQAYSGFPTFIPTPQNVFIMSENSAFRRYNSTVSSPPESPNPLFFCRPNLVTSHFLSLAFTVIFSLVSGTADEDGIYEYFLQKAVNKAVSEKQMKHMVDTLKSLTMTCPFLPFLHISRYLPLENPWNLFNIHSFLTEMEMAILNFKLNIHRVVMFHSMFPCPC